jgi:hypothetical protein
MDTLKFNVEVRRDRGEGLWIRDMPPPHSGRLDADGGFSFRLESIYDVPAGPRAGPDLESSADPVTAADPSAIDTRDRQVAAPCRLTIIESIDGKLLRDARAGSDAGMQEPTDASVEDPSDLMADNEIAIRPAAASNCARVMVDAGGPFEALPCSAHYALSGVLIAQ